MSLIDKMYDMWLIYLLVKAFDKTLALVNQAVVFFCLYLNQKVQIRNHQNKAGSFLLCIHQPQSQMGLQIAWCFLSIFSKAQSLRQGWIRCSWWGWWWRCWNGKWGMHKCDATQCDEFCCLPASCELLSDIVDHSAGTFSRQAGRISTVGL